MDSLRRLFTVVFVSRRPVQLMDYVATVILVYSRQNIPRESSRKCNSPRWDFRRITDRSFSSLEIVCRVAEGEIGWSSS